MRFAPLMFLAVVAMYPGAAMAQMNCYSATAKECFDGGAAPLPTSVAEFLAARDKIGKDPYGGATLFIHAMMVRRQNKELGEQLLVLALNESLLYDHNGKKSINKPLYKSYSFGSNPSFHLGQMDKHGACDFMYAIGAAPENGYKFDAGSVRIRWRKQEKYAGSIESGSYKVFACSPGASTCRPFIMKRNPKGFWKVDNFSSHSVGCMMPKSEASSAADDL